jgi:hypothetical protein
VIEKDINAENDDDNPVDAGNGAAKADKASDTVDKDDNNVDVSFT